MSAAHDINKYSVEKAFQPYEEFCRAMLDAYIVVDNQGRIVKINQFMCQLTSMKSKQILKSPSLDHVIKFFIGDKQFPVQELINQPAPTRLDEVRGEVNGNPNLNLLVGVFPFKSENQSPLGAFILIRDVTAETNLQGKYKDAQKKSISDPLTGLFTRGYFEDYLRLQTSMIQELKESNSPDSMQISIVMIDIDHFKKVNDTYGHQAGDFILKAVAAIMKKTFRKTDIVCRYGGEEFLVILPGTGIEGTLNAAEKVREHVASEKIEFEGKVIPVTISLGVAEIKVGNEKFTDAIARADSSLYEAKRGGRNRVIVAN